MSTFNGLIEEFPNIRIDNFRKWPDAPAPLACFLSHVHSDHLLGLESLKAPFVYCSPATREILLRLEKYPHRLNFAKGILEQRRQSYGHLRKLLKPIPLDTPCVIELAPKNSIRVTLFDANHCIGAVGFLIEGMGESAGKTVLYSGDVRSEPWWVDSLARKPYMIPYISPTFERSEGLQRRSSQVAEDAVLADGVPAADRLRVLSTIYLDTTFATTSLPCYRDFPSKATGLSELLRKCAEFPPDTAFYLRAWTFGYEDVFVALSTALESRIHLDKYRYSLYTSVAKAATATNEAPGLAGYRVGNHEVEGCLTRSLEGVRIHACEIGMDDCSIRQKLDTGEIVEIVPIISRTDQGAEILELGAGGGIGDLDQEVEGDWEVELDGAEAESLGKLKQLLSARLKNKGKRQRALELLEQSAEKLLDGRVKLNLTRIFRVSQTAIDPERRGTDGLPVNLLVEAILKSIELRESTTRTENPSDAEPPRKRRTINFPYSRHSSLSELQYFVSAFRPREVYPCTVELAAWSENVSVEALFGHLCDYDGEEFRADAEIRTQVRERRAYRTQSVRKRQRWKPESPGSGRSSSPEEVDRESQEGRKITPARINESPEQHWRKRTSTRIEHITISDNESEVVVSRSTTVQRSIAEPQTSSRGARRARTTTQWAYEAALGKGGLEWEDMGELESTKKRKTAEVPFDSEEEL